MQNPNLIYELLLDTCSTKAKVADVMIGLVWTLCRQQDNGGIGLAMSPGSQTRVLPWSGELGSKNVMDIAPWINSWEPYQATVAMAAINSCINARPLPDSLALSGIGEYPNLAVFDHFLPELRGKNVVVVGRYPGLERYQQYMQLTVLEKQAQAGDLPDAACEYVLPQADWVFITASSIPNKTFPRLAELASSATTVLMGPTTPWLPQLHEFGINYIAGVEICDADALQQTVAQGGGVKIFAHSLRYRIAALTADNSLSWLKQQIADCAAERQALKLAMEAWYAVGNTRRFPDFALLERVNTRLSRLDSSYKPLWDKQNQLMTS